MKTGTPAFHLSPTWTTVLGNHACRYCSVNGWQAYVACMCEGALSSTTIHGDECHLAELARDCTKTRCRRPMQISNVG